MRPNTAPVAPSVRIVPANPAGSPGSYPSVSRVIDEPLVARLQAQRSFPSVSVLLTTTPGPALATRHVVRLHQLLTVAEARLRGVADPDEAGPIALALQRLAVTARRVPAGRALALYASERHAEAVQLPVAVEDRVVVDVTFATRDLVRSLPAHVRFRLVVLDQRESRLFEGRVDRLEEVRDDGFPVGGAGARHSDRSRRFGRDRSDVRDAGLRAQIRSIDIGLAARRAEEPLPVVVAGVERHLALFRSWSAEAPTVVGEIAGSHGRTSPARLAQLARPVIEDHHRRRSDVALARLDFGFDRGRVVSGIEAAWAAAQRGRVGLLCVEESFTAPAAGPGDRFDDVVDELIEWVSLDGGEVAIVADGALDRFDNVAALLAE